MPSRRLRASRGATANDPRPHHNRSTDRRLGTHDVICPLCGPYHSMHGQRRKVLRVWRVEPGFATFCCARCGETGYGHDRYAPAPDPAKLARLRAEAAEHDRIHKIERLNKAYWLWRQRKPIAGSIAERYLREKRKIMCPLPATLGFLPARGNYAPAVVAAYGMAHEVEPGVIAIADDAVRGVHITRLLPDGSDRARGDQAKIMIGHSVGFPIVMAPANDLLGLAITEGIEDGLTVHQSTGLGAWAAGSASRLAALADAIPSYVGSVTVVIDDDADGWRHATTLIHRMQARRIEVRTIVPNRWRPTSCNLTQRRADRASNAPGF
jgi:Toprim domain